MLLENKVAVLNAHDLCRRETTLCSDPNLSSWPAGSPRFTRGITPEQARANARLSGDLPLALRALDTVSILA
jgi:hypothetical protein